MADGPDLMHVVCCDKDVALCGLKMSEQCDDEGCHICYAGERTEDCWSCLFRERELSLLGRGCGSPNCPHRPLRLRIRQWLSTALLRRSL